MGARYDLCVEDLPCRTAVLPCRTCRTARHRSAARHTRTARPCRTARHSRTARRRRTRHRTRRTSLLVTCRLSIPACPSRLSTTPLSPTGQRRLRTIPSCRPACRPVGGCRAEEGPTYFTQPDATWRLLTAAADPGVAMALRMVYTDTDAGGTGRARLCAVVVAVLSVARRRIWYILIRNCSIVITCVQATLYRVSVF